MDLINRFTHVTCNKLPPAGTWLPQPHRDTYRVFGSPFLSFQEKLFLGSSLALSWPSTAWSLWGVPWALGQAAARVLCTHL